MAAAWLAESRSSQTATYSSPARRAQGVCGPQQSGQTTGHGDQQFVSDSVAVGVVDRLEQVEIDEEHRGGPVRPAVAQKGVFHPLQQQNPVGEPGQRVVQGRLPGAVGGVLEVLPSLRRYGGRGWGLAHM